MLASLPEEVRANVISFLVPFLQGQGHECPVIATGVASPKHRVWKIAGYHWWNLRAAQLVEKVTVRVNKRMLPYFYGIWLGRTFTRSRLLVILNISPIRAWYSP